MISLRQHGGILAAIEAGNPGLAMRRMLLHIRSAERAVLAAHGGPPPQAETHLLQTLRSPVGKS